MALSTKGGRRRVVAVDLDGVFAAFTLSYAALCAQMSGKVVSPLATKWNWVGDYGVTKRQEDAVWEYINNNPMFWHSLESLPGAEATLAHLDTLSADHSIFYVSHRPANAKFWTEMWLGERKVECPTVLLTAQKGKLCQALGVETFLDDKVENALEVYRHLPAEAHVYLYAQPWNQEVRDQWAKDGGGEEAGGGVRVVETLQGFLEREGL